MINPDLEAEFIRILSDHFNIPLNSLSPETQFEGDLGFDSLQMYEVLIIAEEGTKRVLPIEKITGDLTIAGLISLIIATPA